MPPVGTKKTRPDPKNLPSPEFKVHPVTLEFAAEMANDHLRAMEDWRQRFVALATKDKEEALCLAVSYYLSKGLTQKDVAGVLGKSESLVSRAVASAKDRGWLKYDIRGIPPEHLEVLPVFLNETVLAAKILQGFPGLQRCTVVPGPAFFKEFLNSGGSPAPTVFATDIKIEQMVFAAAAERLKVHLTQCPSQTLVAGWGSTINRVIRLLHELRPISDPQGANFEFLKIFPFLGNFSLSRELALGTDASLSPANIEKAFQISIRFSANTNARLLSLLLNQRIPPRPLLTVAILKVSPEALECCQPVFEADQTLMDLYGKFWLPRNRSGAIWQADTLITSVGGATLPEENIYRALGYIPKGNSQFAGDIAGILFDSKGKPVDLEKRYLVGPRLQHLLHIAQRHRTAKAAAPGAGVVVVASGAKKVRPLTILARQNFINELITDETTAQGMLEFTGNA